MPEYVTLRRLVILEVGHIHEFPPAVIFRSESSRDRPSGNRPLSGIIKEASQTLTDDTFGINHDAIDQFLDRRNVANEARDHAATPGASIHIAVDHHLGIDARHLIVDILDLELLALGSFDFEQLLNALVVQNALGIPEP